ncbi:phosphate ABC transporter permease PstA [Marinilabiliaceae bacterium JC040]|nr:phosphate ABC transporter permease PstA [Marinilabiliaceae bacterium JC040]
MNKMKYRRYKDKAFLYLMFLITIIAITPLASIIFELVAKGFNQLNISFFTEVAPTTLDSMLAKSTGNPVKGGIANGIVGTLQIVGIASLMAIPLGVFVGIYLAENSNKKFSTLVSFSTDLLAGIPSIVYGIIAYAWIVIKITDGYSGFAGSVALSIMMLPLVIRSTEESIKMIPASLKEASLALGTSYRKTILRVILPSAMSGLFTGILLSISRVIGETAPLILTALGSQVINLDITKPTSAIPLLIWEFYNDPYLINMIWSSSLFLMLLVLIFNISAKQISKRWAIQ